MFDKVCVAAAVTVCLTRCVCFADRHAHATKDEQKEEERKFKELGEAYSVLSDSKKRSRYDGGQDLEDMADGGSGFGGQSSTPALLSFLFFSFLDVTPWETVRIQDECFGRPAIDGKPLIHGSAAWLKPAL